MEATVVVVVVVVTTVVEVTVVAEDMGEVSGQISHSSKVNISERLLHYNGPQSLDVPPLGDWT